MPETTKTRHQLSSWAEGILPDAWHQEDQEPVGQLTGGYFKDEDLLQRRPSFRKPSTSSKSQTRCVVCSPWGLAAILPLKVPQGSNSGWDCSVRKEGFPASPTHSFPDLKQHWEALFVLLGSCTHCSCSMRQVTPRRPCFRSEKKNTVQESGPYSTFRERMVASPHREYMTNVTSCLFLRRSTQNRAWVHSTFVCMHWRQSGAVNSVAKIILPITKPDDREKDENSSKTLPGQRVVLPCFSFPPKRWTAFHPPQHQLV